MPETVAKVAVAAARYWVDRPYDYLIPAELKEKAQKLDEQLKAISDRTAKFPSLEQIEKRFLDWAIPFLKARITACKEEWFGIEWIAKAIWEFIKDGFETAIAVDETNAALRERLDKAVELPRIEQSPYNGMFNGQTINDDTLLYYIEDGHIKQECFNNKFPEQLQKRLAELKGEKE